MEKDDPITLFTIRVSDSPHEEFMAKFRRSRVQPNVRVPVPGALFHQPADLSVDPQLNEDVAQWCEENARAPYAFVMGGERATDDVPVFLMYFESEIDAVHFKMRWL